MRFCIVDTNVLVSGLISKEGGSPTCQLLDAMLDGRLVYLLSDRLLAEYRAVLMRPNIQGLHGLEEAEVDVVLTTIVANATWCEASAAASDPPDANDSHLWAILAGPQNPVLVTGDRLLLENPPEHREIMTPREFLKRSPL